MQNVEEFDDDVKFVLTPWGCLSRVLEDYGFDTSGIKQPVIGQHMVDDFMKLMEKSGYIATAKDEEVK